MALADLLDELQEIILATLSEIKAPNVEPRTFFTSIQALQQSFVERVIDDRTGLPCVVLEIGKFTQDPDFGLYSQTDRAPVAIHYVTNYKAGDSQRTVDAKLRALAAAIDNPEAEPVSFQAPEDTGAIDTSEQAPINMALLNHSKVPFIAGEVRWDPGLLVER